MICRKHRREQCILCLLKAINQNSLMCNEIDALECHIPSENWGIWLCQKREYKFSEQQLKDCESNGVDLLKYSEVYVNILCILHVKHILWPKALSKMDFFSFFFFSPLP